MLPLRLTLRDFCQHRHRVIDFSKGNVIAITASNGYGKSNIFYALKNALTGSMTPGAKKLEDDIFDQAESFRNEFEFELSNGDLGKITRTVQRKGTNSVVLEIRGKDRVEAYNKSSEAIARFEKLLGIHPREGCEVVIAEQRSIEDLLFAPTAKRLRRFEAFLHGDTFTGPVKALDAEKGALFIDELATDRKKALEDSLKDARFILAGLRALEKRLRATLESKKAAAATAKRTSVQLHMEHRAAFLATKQDLEAVQRSLEEQARTIAAIPANLGQLVTDKETRLNALATAWSAYNTALQLQRDVDNTASALATAVATRAKAKAALQELEAAAERHTTVQQAIRYLTLQQQVQGIQTRQQFLTQSVAAAAEQEQALTLQKAELAAVCARFSGPLVTLREAHTLLCKAQTQGHAAHCPVCESELKPGHAQSLARMIGTLERDLAEPAAQLRETELKLSGVTRDLSGQRRELSLLANQLPIAQRQFDALVAPAKELAGVGLDALQKLSVREVTAAQIRTAQLAESQQQNEVSRLNGQLAVQKAKLPATVTAPAEPESQLDQLKQDVANLHQQDRNLSAALSAQKVQAARQTEVTGKLDLTRAQATAAGLPSLENEHLLTAEESTFLAQLDAGAKELTSHVQNERTQEALIKQLEHQIEQTDACIKGAKDTQAYALHLDAMAGYFKSLPQIIMKSQLLKLCHAMDEIIQGFHFFQPFRLSINDDLDFVLQYPNKLTRPIGKASGGERIILGFAFRLAAHRTLAPEMPWIAIDEPTNHLADENISVMADVVRYLTANLAQYNLKKLIISTHSPLIASQADYQIDLGSAAPIEKSPVPPLVSA